MSNDDLIAGVLARLRVESAEKDERIARLVEALRIAKAALTDLGACADPACREPNCLKALPVVTATLSAQPTGGSTDGE